MLKRPALATLEKLLMPLQGAENWLFTGYIHTAYRETVPLLARHAGFDRVVVQRGIEGGTAPALSRASQFAAYDDPAAEDRQESIDPAVADCAGSELAAALPAGLSKQSPPPREALAEATLSTWHEVLDGHHDHALARSLILSTAQALHQFGTASSLSAAAATVRSALADGRIAQHWQAGVQS